jgi:hypothetical protein
MASYCNEDRSWMRREKSFQNYTGRLPKDDFSKITYHIQSIVRCLAIATCRFS